MDKGLSEKYKFPESRHDNTGFEPDELADEKTPLVSKEEKKDEAEKLLRDIFVDPQLKKILYGLDDYNRVWVSLKQEGAARCVHQISGRFLKGRNEPSKTLKELLGQTKQEAIEQRDKIIDQNQDTIRQLEQSRKVIRGREEGLSGLE